MKTNIGTQDSNKRRHQYRHGDGRRAPFMLCLGWTLFMGIQHCKKPTHEEILTQTETVVNDPVGEEGKKCQEKKAAQIDPCKRETCKGGVLTIISIPRGALCDDSDPRTINDQCDGRGECHGTLKNCDDGKYCTGIDQVDRYGICQSSGNPCKNLREICVEERDICEDRPCKFDSECDDRVFCNGQETCNQSTANGGVCQKNPPPCIGANTLGCNEEADRCITCREAAHCADSEHPTVCATCFDDTCFYDRNATQECEPAHCDQGFVYALRTCGTMGSCPELTPSFCFGFACDGLSCRASCSENKHCIDGYTCQLGLGNVPGICKETYNLAVGKACSDKAQCTSGLCECADENCSKRVCAIEPCDQCVFTTSGKSCDGKRKKDTSCNDGNPCSELDACQGDGSCRGQRKICVDSNSEAVCILDQGACNPLTGACEFTAPEADGKTCSVGTIKGGACAQGACYCPYKNADGSPKTEDCSDNSSDPSKQLDEDCDGVANCNDKDCESHAICLEAENCTNGVDDKDLDTNIDCVDDECFTHPACKILVRAQLVGENGVYANAKGLVSTTQGMMCVPYSYCDGVFARHSSVTLTALPWMGSVFVAWNGCDAVVGNDCTVNVQQTNKHLTVNFDLERYTLTVAPPPTHGKVVTPFYPGIDCGLDCTHDFAYANNIILEAQPNPGHIFKQWNGACSGSATTCYLPMTSAKTVWATFEY